MTDVVRITIHRNGQAHVPVNRQKSALRLAVESVKLHQCVDFPSEYTSTQIQKMIERIRRTQPHRRYCVRTLHDSNIVRVWRIR